MKRIYITFFVPICAIAVSSTFVSCEKWLDIRPQTQVESDVVFEKESGFQDALTGVYLKLSDQALYGKELSFGLVDGLAGQFNGLQQSNEYYPTTNYLYTADNFISKSENIYAGGYNAIANLNNLIENIDRRGNTGFSGVNFHVIRGEAYGLRAFMHFDLLRLFAASAAASPSGQTLPYVNSIGTLPKPRLGMDAFIANLLNDLEVAENELADSDPIVPANTANASTYLRDRHYKFNYYAVKALQARVYLYVGDHANAARAAQEVIRSDVFQWTPGFEITRGEDMRNKLFTQEHIFALNVNNLATTVTPYFDPVNTSTLLAKTAAQYSAVFSTDDFRYVYLTRPTADAGRRYTSKFIAPTGSAARMPLLRKSEMYYIASEALAGTDLPQAVGLLNAVRQARNISELSGSISREQLLAEIELEYRREFIGEGQLFYFYKRKNASAIPDVTTQMGADTYVLPLPESEISYGL